MNAIRVALRTASLILCLGLICLWGRSSAGQDMVGWGWVGPGRESTSRRLMSNDGSAGVFLYPGGPGSAYGGSGYAAEVTLAPMSRRDEIPGVLGFRYRHTAGSNARGVWESATYLLVPYWLLILLTALPPARWLMHTTRRLRRLATDCCRTCGCDLHGLPHVCLECGQAIFAAVATPARSPT